MRLEELIRFIFIGLLSFSATVVFGQQAGVKGKIQLDSGEPASHVTVRVKGTDSSNKSEINGHYALSNVPYGDREIQVTAIEIKPKAVRLKVNKPTHDFSFSVSATGDIAIEDVEVSRMTEKKAIETSGFAVAVIETKEASLRNLTTNELLDRAVGVRVRQNGGIGAAIEDGEGSRMKENKAIETSGFAVAVIETKEASLRNLTTNELLDRAVGVRVRQNGGIGAPIEYNLNGMSGSAVGIFLDGIEVST